MLPRFANCYKTSLVCLKYFLKNFCFWWMSTASLKIARSLASNPIFPSTFALRSHRVCSYTLWNFSEFLSLDTGFWASQNWATQRIESHPRVTNALSSPSSTSRRFKKKKLHFFPACRAVMIFFFAPPSPKRNFKTFIIGCTIESPNFKECLSGPSFLWPIILMNLHIGWRFKEVKAQVQHQHPKLKVSFFQEMNLNAFFVVSNYSIILETCSVVHSRKFKSHTLDYIHHENFGVPPNANPP